VVNCDLALVMLGPHVSHVQEAQAAAGLSLKRIL
jgi:hypothetical protein